MEITETDRKIAKRAHWYKWTGNALVVFGVLLILGTSYMLAYRTVEDAVRPLLFSNIAFGVGYVGAGSLLYTAYGWIERYRGYICKSDLE